MISLVWSEGDARVRLPCDFRIYTKATDGATKSTHFQQRLMDAVRRGFQPNLVACDSWYASLANLKFVRARG